ncbi:Fc receptor-like A isoform X1 [Oryzias latipes]|uniref:Fc receptor-like A isoform X1 n=1 Tax=Oryzias latipes TaxID=8090 RepID=UPI0009DAE5F7|nr:Fc receptor-like A isoform X1 [Oryzias latipes]
MEVAQLCLMLSTLSISPERSQFRRYETIFLNCEANSTGWTVKRNTSMRFNQNCQYGWGIPEESSCRIDTAYPSDTGVYWCQNDHGECSNVVNVTVTESPVIMESPPYGVTEGDSVTLRCSYKEEHQDSSTSNFSANFYQDGEFLEEGKEGRMVLTSISRSSEGFYTCEHSSRRKMSAKSWLAVKAKVKLPEAPPTPDPPHIIWIRITAGVMVFVLHITVFLLCLYTYRRSRCCQKMRNTEDGIAT